MASKHFILLLPLLLLLLFFASVTLTEAYMPVTEPIGTNISDPYYQSVGRFAVDEYNKQGISHLYFLYVYSGYIYYVFPVQNQGVTYILDLKAINCSNNGAMGDYTGKVIETRFDGKKLYYDSLTPKYN